jgi:hypothetical protein
LQVLKGIITSADELKMYVVFAKITKTRKIEKQ